MHTLHFRSLLAASLLAAGSASAAVVYVGTADSDVTSVVDLGGGSTVWTADNTYVLQDIVFVTNGTLYIEEGTVIRGQPRTDTNTFNAGALVIAANAKIIAQGSISNPIIFTTASTTGGKTGGRASGANPSFWDASPKTNPRPLVTTGNSFTNNGTTGGLVILGNAPTNVDRDPSTARVVFAEEGLTTLTGTTDDRPSIEGIPTGTAANNLGLDRYGGNDHNDSSGVLQYVSLRFGGSNLSSNNEINGLTLGGVGAGTLIENVEIFGSTDDGIEVFGGTVNMKNLSIMGVEDDGLDIDVGWQGIVQNLLVVGFGRIGTTDATDKLIEWDGSYANEGTVNGFANPSPVNITRTASGSTAIYNATLIGNRAYSTTNTGNNSHILHIRDQALPGLFNSIVVNTITGGIRIDTRDADTVNANTQFDYDAVINRLVLNPSKGRGFGIKSNTFFRAGATSLNDFVTTPSPSTVYSITAPTTAINALTAVQTYLANAANGNSVEDPAFANLPTSGATQAELGANLNLNPRSDPFISGSDTALYPAAYTQPVTYRGAFPTTDDSAPLWTTGWTAANKLHVIVD